MRLAIVVVPFFITDQHLRWAQSCLQSICFREPVTRIAIVNRCLGTSAEQAWFQSSFDHWETNDRNNLSRAWNKGIEHGFKSGADFVIVMNLDIVLHPQCLNNLAGFAYDHPEFIMWSATMWRNKATLMDAQLGQGITPDIHWSCFMLDRRLPEIVGSFDEGFDPAYFEDADMRRRITLKGLSGGSTESALFYHLENGTIKGCMDGSIDDVSTGMALMSDLKEAMDRNGARYIKKWGGPPYEEKFSIPFGAKES